MVVTFVRQIGPPQEKTGTHSQTETNASINCSRSFNGSGERSMMGLRTTSQNSLKSFSPMIGWHRRRRSPADTVGIPARSLFFISGAI